jgi:DNA-binding NarL/FixJ family response regulator
MNLMIVDDHAGMRQMIRQIAGAPAAVCECADGQEALARAGAFAPDFVTMDLRLPGISGLEATRAIVAAHPNARVVIVSTYDNAELRRAAAEAGASGFVAKDNLEELRSQLGAGPKPAAGP